MKMIRKILTVFMVTCLSLTLLARKAEAKSPFSDVNTSTSGYTEIMWAYNNGIIKGVGNGKFDPTGSLTRAQMAVMIWKFGGSPDVSGKSPFTDIGKYSSNVQKAITWCYNLGFVKGTSSTKFNPDGHVTREQMAVVLWRMFGEKEPTMNNPFTDLGSCSANVKKAILWAYSMSITKGTSDTKFSPGKNCTRAQFCIFLYRFGELLSTTNWASDYFEVRLPDGWAMHYRNRTSSNGMVNMEFFVEDDEGTEVLWWDFSTNFGTGYFPYEKQLDLKNIHFLYDYFKGDGTYAQVWYTGSGGSTYGGWISSTLSESLFVKIFKTLKLR